MAKILIKAAVCGMESDPFMLTFSQTVTEYLIITFNYKEGTKRVTFAEIEEAFGSDLSSLTAPTKKQAPCVPAFWFCVGKLVGEHEPKFSCTSQDV